MTITATTPADEPGTAPTGAYLIHLDPRTVLAHAGNLRTNLGDLTELKASIAANGVAQACTVMPDGDGFRLVAGHRRTAAAAAVLDEGNWPDHLAPTVPYLVRPDLSTVPADQVALMLVENDEDQRTPLKPSERAAGYAQLAAFDLDHAEIARRIGKSVKHVSTALRVHQMGATVTEHLDAGRLTFEDATLLAEFEDDPKALARILKDATNPWGIKHRVTEERRKRDDRAREQEIRAQLAADGATIVPKPKGWPYQCAAARVTDLTDPATGQQLNPEEVKTRDGFGYFIDTQYSPPTATLVCLNPDAHGYERATYTSYRSPEQKAAEEAAEQQRQARIAAFTEASQVRQRFLVERYGNAKAAKTLFVDALRAVVENPHDVDRGTTTLVQALAGGDVQATADAKQDRLIRLLVAGWIANQESHLVTLATRGGNWHRRYDRAVAWLDRLVGDGYELSQIEAAIREELATRAQAEHDEDYPDEDYPDEDEISPGGPAFVLLYNPADGWVLTDDTTGDAIETWPTDPAQTTVEQAQQWATDVLAERGHTVTTWTVEQQAGDDQDDPTSHYYLATITPTGPTETAPDQDGDELADE